MLANEIRECPHCGDTENGYRYIVTQRYEQNRGWGNDESGNSCGQDIGIDHHGACRCNNCHRIVKPREL